LKGSSSVTEQRLPESAKEFELNLSKLSFD
jgi:hypothetical protein